MKYLDSTVKIIKQEQYDCIIFSLKETSVIGRFPLDTNLKVQLKFLDYLHNFKHQLRNYEHIFKNSTVARYRYYIPTSLSKLHSENQILDEKKIK